jgi:hypothetical protein
MTIIKRPHPVLPPKGKGMEKILVKINFYFFEPGNSTLLNFMGVALLYYISLLNFFPGECSTTKLK